MAKGYWIARVDVTNEDGFKTDYAAFVAPLLKTYGGKFLVRGGKQEGREGNSRKRNVVVEFADYATALTCYNSPEYQKLVGERQKNADTDFLIIEGYDGPQP
jgi:uncharacterized protein (DUF1330 family)